uniref:Uncharacterized protein n=1 Tax=Anguilla anguilla TaxID=7936 RepID=A0A0E9QVK3_ANGAN
MPLYSVISGLATLAIFHIFLLSALSAQFF